MSSEGSVMSSVSRIRQFGLYRSIDARTEEFLRASRKRQIRQGCACAAVSTAITVTVVVVILLIYEYTIAVEWNIVQSKGLPNRRKDITEDLPFADRLDRSELGFDQDYFERMPLLINSLQENSYIDPVLEMSRPLSNIRKYNKTYIRATTITPRSYVYNTIKRTSPRPFFFQYRSPTPLPFSKLYRSRSWIESYRNEERLKNIRQIIKYLENTNNAKVADMQTKPPSNHIAFTGIYIEPMIENKDRKIERAKSSDLNPNPDEKFVPNHQADPLFMYKPENPGDVNLLADDFLRFGPIPTPTLAKSSSFKISQRIPSPKHECFESQCIIGNQEKSLIYNENIKTDTPPVSTTKSFSVMLNLYPINPNFQNEFTIKEYATTTQSVDNIYLTTLKPKIQFKRKAIPLRRFYPLYKKPRYLSSHKKEISDTKPKTTTQIARETQMIVHVKVYNSDENTDFKNKSNILHKVAPISSILKHPYTTKSPVEMSTSQIEESHMGSSGYLPIEIKTNTPPMLTDFGTTIKNYMQIYPDILQFSREDAKIPGHYQEYKKKSDKQYVDISKQHLNSENMDNEPSTLIVKLKNHVITTTSTPSTQAIEVNTENILDTTVWTYVPQINGHYRSIHHKDNTWVKANEEIDRKTRLEMSVSGIQTYVPMYTVIKRNTTETVDDE